MERYKILSILGIIVMAITLIFTIMFIITTIDLYKFRSCYDINFQDVSCQKYLNY